MTFLELFIHVLYTRIQMHGRFKSFGCASYPGCKKERACLVQLLVVCKPNRSFQLEVFSDNAWKVCPCSDEFGTKNWSTVSLQRMLQTSPKQSKTQEITPCSHSEQGLKNGFRTAQSIDYLCERHAVHTHRILGLCLNMAETAVTRNSRNINQLQQWKHLGTQLRELDLNP